MEKREIQGEWWLPDVSDTKVAGTLVIDEEGNTELRLIGALTSELADAEPPEAGVDGSTVYHFTEDSIAAGGVYPRILGSAGATGFTLDDCFRTHRSMNLFGGLPSERIHVHRVFHHVHFEADEQLQFTKIVVRLHALAYWVQKSGFEETVHFHENEDKSMKVLDHTLKVSSVESEVIDGPDGATVTLSHTYGIRGDNVVERRLTQDFTFAVSFQQLTDLDQLLAQASALQDLVSLGTGRTAAFEEITLRHPEVSQQMGEKKRQIPIELTAPWTVRLPVPQKEMKIHDVVFSLPDIGGMEGVSKWLDVAKKNQSALGRVMTTRYAEKMYATDHLLNCAAALEAYDRDKYGDNSHYVDRLKRCVDLAGEHFEELVGDADTWAKALKDNRNTVAHHLSTIEGASTEQIVLSQSAFWLFAMCLLRDAEAPEVVFTKLTEQPSWGWLRKRLLESLAP